MKKKHIIILVVVTVFVIEFYVAFTLGKYSHLITTPEVLLGNKEKWIVKKAREYALNEGIGTDRLENPRVVNTATVYFGGAAGLGGVEVTVTRDNAQFLQIKY